MDDKKLLELAAKAAGIEIEPCTCSDERFPVRLKMGMATGTHFIGMATRCGLR